jgi:hypothetical protein
LNDCESKNIEKIGKDFWTHILLVLGENKDGTTRTVKYNRDKDWTLFSSVLDFF